MVKVPKRKEVQEAAAEPPVSSAQAEFDAMVASGLIDADDLLNKNQRKAKLRKQLKGVKKPSGDYWSSLGGWKSVEGGDDLLLGAEEGGFAGLEILEDPTLIDPAMWGAPHGASTSVWGTGAQLLSNPILPQAVARQRTSSLYTSSDPVCCCRGDQQEEEGQG